MPKRMRASRDVWVLLLLHSWLLGHNMTVIERLWPRLCLLSQGWLGVLLLVRWRVRLHQQRRPWVRCWLCLRLRSLIIIPAVLPHPADTLANLTQGVLHVNVVIRPH